MYKQEYTKIQAIARYVDQLDEKGTKKRARELRAADHPSALRRLRRRFTNLFNTFRDSVMEAVNLLIGRAKKGPGIGTVLSSQDKYVSELRTGLFNSVGTAYEPLLERHIGKHVILEMIRSDKVVEYAGILKDYTADFLSLMDIEYAPSEEDAPRKADLIVPRTVGVIRHLAE